jgi:hypothetical protein
MNDAHFDTFAQTLAAVASRRALLGRALLSLTLAATTPLEPHGATARKRGKGKKKKKVAICRAGQTLTVVKKALRTQLRQGAVLGACENASVPPSVPPPVPPPVCRPDCTGKGCGDDGCGGTCGQCGTGQVCVNGACTNGNLKSGEPCDAGRPGECQTGICGCGIDADFPCVCRRAGCVDFGESCTVTAVCCEGVCDADTLTCRPDPDPDPDPPIVCPGSCIVGLPNQCTVGCRCGGVSPFGHCEPIEV